MATAGVAVRRKIGDLTKVMDRQTRQVCTDFADASYVAKRSGMIIQ